MVSMALELNAKKRLIGLGVRRARLVKGLVRSDCDIDWAARGRGVKVLLVLGQLVGTSERA
jgi:hypothetical protein